MGLYNFVDIAGDWGTCGLPLVEWQTKDAEVLGRYPVDNILMAVHWEDITGGEVYAYCNRCKHLAIFDVKENNPQ